MRCQDAPKTQDQNGSVRQQSATLLHGGLFGRNGPNQHTEKGLCPDVNKRVADLLVHEDRGACQAPKLMACQASPTKG
eukprot:CAMPEP_0115065374 /NCGR_PEP_ID=MMETSP0227-20121206/10216_1 /TAXON_ID=89957 /ORGANISM="Polarella glacialis, Strain CCMP 1383" /LENGTH=77 /DNA_ID=CAMNT_0002451157 /DNA_START=123 /DNA_END=356 /DNA_ORIENTATION=-